jgi:hypothetical protein
MTTLLDVIGSTLTENGTADTADSSAAQLVESSAGATPDHPSPAYLRMKPRWLRCRALMGGSDGIRAGGELYNPRFDGETDEQLAARISLCALTNFFSRTVKACVGMLLQKRPELGQDMPQEFVDFWEDVDGVGTHGAVFTKQLATDAMIDGHSGLLVDYQRVPNAAAVDASQEKQLGLRPYWVEFRAQDIFLMLYQTINGRRTLILLVLREIVEESYNRFGIRARARYRVYVREPSRVTCELWTSAPGGGTPAQTQTPVAMQNVTEIPFSLCIAGEKITYVETRPPLLDLADLNIEHHQIKTDIRNLERLAMVPTVVRKGYVAPVDDNGEPDPAPVLLGPRQVIDVPTEGDVKWLTPDTAVLDPAMKSLEDVKLDMGTSGLSFLAPEQARPNETAEAKRIDAAAQNASLATFASNMQDCLEAGAGFTVEFMGLPEPEEGSITVNTDFERAVMSPATISALGTLAANGKLSIETLLALLERGQVLDDGFDREAELARILKETTLPPAAQPTDTGGTDS